MVVLMMMRWWLGLAVVLVVVAGLSGSRSYGQERQVVEMVAERFTFTPSRVEVPVGTTLELRVRSQDTMHGFRIVGHEINVAVPKRRQGEAVVVFEATTVGRYRFECSRLCGAGHNFMRGEIVVVEVEE
jgi:cytochrome c oxidase subunit 2